MSDEEWQIMFAIKPLHIGVPPLQKYVRRRIAAINFRHIEDGWVNRCSDFFLQHDT